MLNEIKNLLTEGKTAAPDGCLEEIDQVPPKKDTKEAVNTIASMIERSEKAQGKFELGTSQHTLLKNRIRALYVASSLMRNELGEGGAMVDYAKEDFEGALAPINSLISKSEKAQGKLRQGAWQHAMLADNLKALLIALPMLKKASGGGND